MLQFPQTGTSSAKIKLCEFCGEPRETAQTGGFVYHRQCQCAGAREARDARAQDLAQREAEKQAQRCEYLLQRAGLDGGRARRQTFESFVTDTTPRRKARAWAERYVESFGDDSNWPVLYGPPGTGKTHLSRAIARAVVTQYGVTALVVNFLEWYQGLKADLRNEKQILGRVCAVGFLVVDDLDRQNLTEYSQVKLYEIINQRYERAAPVVITTNRQDLEQFLQSGRDVNQLTGAVMYDRIYEMAEWVKFSGASYRRRAR